MSDMVQLGINVSKELADRIIKSGKAEVVTRLKNARFDAFTKCPIVLDKGLGSETSAKILSAASSIHNGTTSDIGKMTGALKAVKKRMDTANGSLQAITSTARSTLARVSTISTQLSGLSTLSYITIGVGIANLAISTIGFYTVNKRLDMINENLREISSKIDSIHFCLTSETIEDFQDMVMRFSSISTRMRDHDEVGRQELDDLLIKMRTFISKLIRNFTHQAMDAEIILGMIFDLLTTYSVLLNMFVRSYYFEKQKTPDNLDGYVSLIKELMDDNFIEKVRDYLILDKKMHVRDAIQALQIQQLLTLNCFAQIEDNADILKIVQTKQAYDELVKAVDNSIMQEIPTIIAQVAAKTDESQETCAQVFEQAQAVFATASA